MQYNWHRICIHDIVIRGIIYEKLWQWSVTKLFCYDQQEFATFKKLLFCCLKVINPHYLKKMGSLCYIGYYLIWFFICKDDIHIIRNYSCMLFQSNLEMKYTTVFSTVVGIEFQSFCRNFIHFSHLSFVPVESGCHCLWILIVLKNIQYTGLIL